MCTAVKLNKITDEVVGSVLKLMPGKVYKIFLYGSYARGDNTPESDIDIMIIFDSKQDLNYSTQKSIRKYASRIGLEMDALISIAFSDKEEFLSAQEYLPFYQNIVKEGISLYDCAA
ncbi:MAG: nucleotidyltransferase domain-containing protein [Phascolarctobacterium sp.]|nr:nucleotidyltransferase domain-containing protein [Phascolarctobacterium sp.]